MMSQNEKSTIKGDKKFSLPKTYIAIDLKSFYASVECQQRGLDPLRTNLVVADASRTEKTICLAVSPSLKSYGIPGRARLFEVVQKVREVNARRLTRAPGHVFSGKSFLNDDVQSNPSLELDYITAVPQMALYMKESNRIYQIYLKYIAPEDIYPYSIDEVFIDATSYLSTYRMSAHDLAMRMIRDVLKETGITATAGIGTNLYLAKIAMDIEAKHAEPDADGVRIAQLDEMSYRRQLWTHRPLTDFWRVGPGYARKLEQYGMHTMGDVARCSIGRPNETHNEELLYRLFGVNAELLIDHAWGYEPCTMDLIKAYEPENNSFSYGQVLQSPYPVDRARIVVWEMADAAALDLVSKKMVTDQVVLTVSYDTESLQRLEIRRAYKGEVTKDRYGRMVPKHAHGTSNLERPTSSGKEIVRHTLEIFDRTVNPGLLVRRLNIAVNHVQREDAAEEKASQEQYEQLDLFTDYAARDEKRKKEKESREKERSLQEAMLSIRKKYGSNSILKGLNLEEGATGRDRNAQIGGHKA